MIYGLDKIKKDELVYVTEGPFDSTFIRNSIAMCGSDVNLSSDNHRYVFVFDNEPRNKQIVDRIEKTIQKGHQVVAGPGQYVGRPCRRRQ